MPATAQATTELARLSPAETESYHRDGFVEVFDVFSNEDLAEINVEINRLRADKAESHDNENFIFALGLRSDLTRQVCEDPRILALIENLVKPGIAIYSAKMVEKQPFDSAVCHWHQDDAYYQQKSLSECRMSVWIPLQDCDETNGCVWMVPGSHKWGLRDATDLRNDHEKAQCTLAFAHGKESIEGAVPVHARAGSAVLFHALTWHRSLGNQTDAHRRAFIISYQDALAAQGNGKQHRILRPAA